MPRQQVHVEAVPKPKSSNRKDPTPSFLPGQFHSLSIVGSRTSGKTNLIVWCLLNGWVKAYDRVIILSPSIHFDDTWKALHKFSNVFVGDKCDNRILEDILASQKARYKDNRKLTCLVIIDDFGVQARTNAGHKKALEKLYSTCRHYGMSVVCSFQHALMATPAMRTNSTHMIFFSLNHKELVKLAEEFRCHLTDKEFIAAAQMATKERYQFLYIDFYAKSREAIFNQGFQVDDGDD